MTKAELLALIADDEYGLLEDNSTPEEREIAQAFANFFIKNFEIERKA